MTDAMYYDGESARRQPVTLVIHQRVLAMRGADGLHRSIRLSRLDISERLDHAPRLLRFPDGGHIEVAPALLAPLLRANRYGDGRIVRWQRNWPLSLAALVFLLALLIGAYQWALPWAAERAAGQLPATMLAQMGDSEIATMDRGLMAPSRLPQEQQTRLRDMFAAMRQPDGTHLPYRLAFRDGSIGPNAFALPNGVIVMTDQLVRVAGSDTAVLGVLSHELGHLRHHHAMRGLLQALGIGAVLNLALGDVSTVVAAAPALLLTQNYSRDFEREADRYAITMMQLNHLPLTPMAELFEKMQAGRGERDAALAASEEAQREAREQAQQHPGESPTPHRLPAPRTVTATDFFSSHPSDAERIALLRRADAAQDATRDATPNAARDPARSAAK